MSYLVILLFWEAQANFKGLFLIQLTDSGH